MNNSLGIVLDGLSYFETAKEKYTHDRWLIMTHNLIDSRACFFSIR